MLSFPQENRLPTWTDPDQSKSPIVRELHAWWLSKRGPSGIADRADVDPIALRKLLPNIIISEVETEPFRIRYRLVGTKIAAVTGFDFTGRYLDEIIAAGSETPWIELYVTICESRAPLLGSVTETTTNGGKFTYEFGIFPLAVGGTAVKQFIAIEDYFGFQLTSAELQPWPRP
jgi:hypothetical protein